MATASVAATRLQPLIDDLSQIFGARLISVSSYGWHKHGPMPSLALVASLTLDDLTACAARTARWQRAGIATPLILPRDEFVRSLDAFPIEYDEILATGEVVFGGNPFEGCTINEEDVRRACEVQIKSHLVHLREDYMETGGRPGEVSTLVRDSAPAFGALIRHLARLDRAPTGTTGDLLAYAARRAGLDARVVGDLLTLAEPEGLSSVDAVRLLPAYLDALERLASFIDTWRRS